MRQINGLAILLAIILVVPVQAAIDVYQFENDEQQARFKQLTADLRCPKCQNQNIADSNAEIARDLRTKIHYMLVANKSDQEIVDYMVQRYGDFVLYQPRITAQTWLLWFGPVLLLILALLTVFLIVRWRRQRVIQTETEALNEEQRQQLADLLNKEQDS